VEEAGAVFGCARYVVLNVGKILARVSTFGHVKFKLKLALTLVPKLTAFIKRSNESIIRLFTKLV
jgi:hypothetical protein